MQIDSTRRALVAFAATLPFGLVHAQDDGMLRFVVPFAAGSTIDAIARLFANKLPEVSNRYKVVVVDNRVGAAGIIGTSFVAKAKPDGRTILIQANGLTTTPSVRDDLPYDLQKDLTPITLIGVAPYALVVPGNSPAKSLTDLFDQARQAKQPVTFGTSGSGSQSEFVIAQVAKTAKVEFLKVPFKGQADIMLAVMGGTVQLAMINMPSAVKQAHDGKVRILATMTDRRTAATPDVPTLAEAGVPGINEGAWYGLMTAAGTPQAIVEAMTKDFQAVLALPDVRNRLADLGIDVVGNTPAQFNERLSAELVRYKRIAKEENMKAD
ncbi:tripartite tricarboxylate transporter substrate-binding protein [Variovorax sp. Sphag1AA]|uniref:tripartite tricarboxylate transporter substrate-binding protein n=1 Tax=Variovorax sp. Sphag1AA TaxID=2587027 RepID=UPI0016218B13|nr:tripartite tricarboxylate transporter substrate-binding protein [Variovorax sp. Sphag1AA]